MGAAGGFIGCLFMIVHFGLGLVALLATWEGVAEYLGVHDIVALIIVFFIVNIPLVGTFAGIYGATEVWGWPLWQAVALFFGPFLLVLAISMISALFDRRQ